MLTLLADRSFWLEDAASSGARTHDATFYTILYVTGFFFLLVVSLMLVFIVKYRRRAAGARQGGPTHNTPLEIAWTGIPLIIVIVFFGMGFRAFMDLEVPPANAEVVEVTAKKWKFDFTYPNGATSDVLYVPVDRPVRVLLRAEPKDVTHGFFIPAFRVQRNAIPNRTTELWFTAKDPGTYGLYCTQYCGDGHSQMTTSVVVLSSADYAKKLTELSNPFKDPASGKAIPYYLVGEKLRNQLGCNTCHSIDGSPNTGPTWKNTWKTDHEFAASNVPGYTLKASDPDDKFEAYIRESILQPDAKIVKGFTNQMSPYAAQLSGSPVKEMKLRALVEYIHSLNDPNYDRTRAPDLAALGPAAASATATAPATQP